MLDVLHNIFSSTDKEYRDKNYEKLLKTYYSSLSETIRKLGSDPEKLFSYDDFQNELRRFGKINLLTAPLVAQIKVAHPDDVEDLDEYCERIENGDKNFDLLKKYNEEKQEKFNDLVNGIVVDLINYGYIEEKIESRF